MRLRAADKAERGAARPEGLEVGVDIGATLAKVARAPIGNPDATSFDLLLSSDLELIASHIAGLKPARLGITGGGATRLGTLLEQDAHHVGEFDAWATGARQLLSLSNGGSSPVGAKEGFLVVSLGTGTSVLHVSPAGAVRVGGTALGGGTIVGLGAALTRTGFKDLCRLAEEGSAGGVDLRVSDVYGKGEIQLAGDLTAANFGKFARHAARRGDPISETSQADLAAGVMQLVGENVALICAGLAAATKSKKIAYGGSSIRANRRLVEVLDMVTRMCGLEPLFPPDGEFAGALGALALAREAG